MPTLPERAEMRQRAIDSIKAQTVPVSLVLDHDPTDSLGRKLNRMIENSDAEYFVLTDDDDWHSPTRAHAQLQPLFSGFDVSGTSKIYYFAEKTNLAFLYSGNPSSWMGGLAFTRAAWERLKFDDFTLGVDTRWLRDSKADKFDLANPLLFVAGLHERNSCWKNVNGRDWSPADINKLPQEFLATLAAHA